MEIQSTNIDKISTALSAAQGEAAGGIEKKGWNKHHGFAYVTLTDIRQFVRPIFASNGLSTTDSCHSSTVIRDGKGTKESPFIVQVDLETVLRHNSGQWLKILTACWGSNREKAIFSAQTIGRKYAQMALIGLGGDQEEDEPVEQRSPMESGQSSKDAPEKSDGAKRSDSDPIDKDDRNNLESLARERCKELQITVKGNLQTCLVDAVRAAGFDSASKATRKDLMVFMRNIKSWEPPKPQMPIDDDVPF